VSSVRSQLGVRVGRDLDLADLGLGVTAGTMVNASLKLGWAHELSDTGRTTAVSFAGTPGTSFAVDGAQRGRDSALVGLGIAARLDETVGTYLRYEGDVNGRDAAHALIGGVRVTW
jgi:outer membrane autotransporter protein